jgi:gas vesicle protein
MEMAHNNEGYGVSTWFIFGALMGVVAGMVLAPKSGRETREMIGDQARNWRDKANYQAGRLRERASERASTFPNRMNDQEAGRQ